MFGIGVQELILILLICLLIFGAAKLPEMGKSLGKALKEFKKAGKEIKSDVAEEGKEEKQG